MQLRVEYRILFDPHSSLIIENAKKKQPLGNMPRTLVCSYKKRVPKNKLWQTFLFSCYTTIRECCFKVSKSSNDFVNQNRSSPEYCEMCPKKMTQGEPHQGHGLCWLSNKQQCSCKGSDLLYRHAHTTSKTASPHKDSLSIHQDILFTEIFTYFNSLHKGNCADFESNYD